MAIYITIHNFLFLSFFFYREPGVDKTQIKVTQHFTKFTHTQNWIFFFKFTTKTTNTIIQWKSWKKIYTGNRKIII